MQRRGTNHWDEIIFGRMALTRLSVLIVGWFGTPSAYGIDPESAALVERQIQTGEFSTALATARSTSDAADRNAILAQVARAQNVAGDRQGALRTVSQMDDDRVVTDTLTAVRSQPSSKKGQFGGSEADFDPLINLITSTIAPSTWSEMGGPGSVAPFPAGVYIDGQ